VVLDLPGTWDELLSGLKRNVRESIRRATNRLEAETGPWEIQSDSNPGPGLSEATRQLVELNHARSSMQGRVHHPSPLASQRHVDFFAAAVAREAAAGRAEILTLRLNGAPIAAALVLHAVSGSYLSLTGFRPQWWHLSPVTTLTAAAIRKAIERGHRSFNLSVGADVAKLRWSEQLRLYQDFFVVRDGVVPRAAFSTFTSLRALALFQRETRRHGAQRRGRGVASRLGIGS
jgi:CelD/BcsL family acetyltransferase involved in cellulose biosynthesis